MTPYLIAYNFGIVD